MAHVECNRKKNNFTNIHCINWAESFPWQQVKHHRPKQPRIQQNDHLYSKRGLFGWYGNKIK